MGRRILNEALRTIVNAERRNKGVAEPRPISTVMCSFLDIMKTREKLLLVVIRYVEVKDEDGYTTYYSFAVIEIDIKKGKFKEVKDLGNKSIFLSTNEGLCTHASLRYGCKPKCKLFSLNTFSITDDVEGMEVFDLAD
ncbi:hypothetical protein Droror1_Dr00012741, partial [Drosera rotundifolia]